MLLVQQQHLLQALTGGGPVRVLALLLPPHLTAGQHWRHLLPAHPQALLAARWCDALQRQRQQSSSGSSSSVGGDVSGDDCDRNGAECVQGVGRQQYRAHAGAFTPGNVAGDCSEANAAMYFCCKCSLLGAMHKH
jgi:hypothetical protein